MMRVAGARVFNWAAIVAVCLVIAGCSTHRCPVCNPETRDKIPPDKIIGGEYFCGDDYKTSIGKLQETIRHESSVDVLLLSGGGSRGSFGAGILYGWDSEPFDMVTGISTGSILATWAYLGRDHKSNPYEVMKASYNGGVTNKEIRKRRWLFPFVDSMYSLGPLEDLLEKVIPDEMILEVGRIYDETGRQLWIGSTNLETGQFCHWNLGERALAARQAKGVDDVEYQRIIDKYRRLIIASSANPTVFQSVEIEGFTHVDGGVSETIYVERLDFIAKEVARLRKDEIDAINARNRTAADEGSEEEREKPDLKPLNVYAIVNGRLISSQKCAKDDVYSLATRSINLLSKSATRGNLDRIKVTVDDGFTGIEPEYRDWNYHTGWIRYDKILSPPDSFEPKKMAELFDHGLEWIAERRWCEGVPSMLNSEKNCGLPRAGRKSCK